MHGRRIASSMELMVGVLINFFNARYEMLKFEGVNYIAKMLDIPYIID